jgi:hypothetical protein
MKTTKTIKAKRILLNAIAIVVAFITVFSCGKDYDGDIKNLTERIDKVDQNFKDLQAQLNGLSYIRSARIENGTIILEKSDGTTINYAPTVEPTVVEVKNGTEIWVNGEKVGSIDVADPVIEIKNGTEIWVNGEKVGSIDVPATEDPEITLSDDNEILVNGKGTGIMIPGDPVITLNEDRKLVVNGVVTDIEIPAPYDGPNITIIKDSDGNITGIEFRQGEDVAFLPVIGNAKLTSAVFIPDNYINGIEAIKFVSLSYVPQVFNKDHAEGNYTTKDNGDAFTIGNGETTVNYHLNQHATPECFEYPSFLCRVAENEMTRSVNSSLAGENSPIMPVPGQKFVIKNGVLSVKVRKAVTSNIDAVSVDGSEKFYTTAIKLPIAEKYITAEQKKAGITAVISDYARLAEKTITPYIMNVKAGEEVGVYAPGYPKFPNEIDIDGKPLHYSDSTWLYNSTNEQYIDEMVVYNKTLDLKKLVSVCDKDSHNEIENYKSYGLTYRFYIATGKYLQGTNETDEQQFGKIDSPANGILSSKVYTVGNDGESRTAIGREPIVRAVLMDTVNNNVVCIRYIKVRWVENVIPPITLDPYKFKDGVISCDVLQRVFGTQEMNELIYHKVNESMSKTEFHEAYKTISIESLTKDGKNILSTLTSTVDEATDADVKFYLRPDLEDNTSYNLVWELSPKAIGKVDPAKGSEFVIKVKFKGTGGYGDVTMEFKVKVTVPTQEFTYNGTFWKGGTHNNDNPVFNINPIVFSTERDGEGTTTGSSDGINTKNIKALNTSSPYSQIKTDLVNGYMYKPTSAKPTSLAQLIRYIRSCADVKFVFDADKFSKYDYLAGYKVNPTQTELWKTTVGTFNDAPDADRNVKYQDDNLAAWIDNAFGATAEENKKNLPYDFNEPIGSGVDEASAMIQLAELDFLNGTSAAKNLVGKLVPIKLLVQYNQYNIVAVDEFEVFFIDPITIDPKFGGELSDNIVDGSFLGVQKAFTSTDWNKYTVAAENPSTGAFDKYAEQLYHYYGVKGLVIDTENVTTDLTWNGSSYDQKDGVRDGKLPTGASLKQFAADKTTEVDRDPIWLGYFNNNGTPVNKDYHLFVGTKVEHKWGTANNDQVEILVKKRLDD